MEVVQLRLNMESVALICSVPEVNKHSELETNGLDSVTLRKEKCVTSMLDSSGPSPRSGQHC